MVTGLEDTGNPSFLSERLISKHAPKANAHRVKPLRWLVVQIRTIIHKLLNSGNTQTNAAEI